MIKILNRKYLEISAFIGGSVIMTYEMVASRILAPFVGTSVLVWTSIIGIFLLSLSTGYYLGGKTSDKYSDKKTFSIIIILSGVLMAFSLLLSQSLQLSYYLNIDLRMKAVLLSLIMFSPTTVMLGMFSPYVARLSMKDIKNSGKTIGKLYAISTLGSLIGTFLGGFILISFLPINEILFYLIVILILWGYFVYPIKKDKAIILLVALTILISFFLINNKSFVDKNLIADINTSYDRFFILEREFDNTPSRLLVNDIYGVQSGIKINNPTELLFNYSKIIASTTEQYMEERDINALLIGGGAFTFPTFFTHRWPNSSITVIEIDNKLKDISEEYFYFEDSNKIKIIEEDGRTAIRKLPKKSFDVILLDAYNSELSIPFHLTTKEFFEDLQKISKEESLIIINIVGTIGGTRDDFTFSMIKTVQSVFSNIILKRTEVNDKMITSQNFILIASNKKIPQNIIEDEKTINYMTIKNQDAKGIILTDSFSPIEFFTQLNK